MPYPILIFDLDDTLLDTWGQLVQPAAREACAAMIAAGLATDPATCVAKRHELFVAKPRDDCYRGLVDHFGVDQTSDPDTVRDAGHRAYFERNVETTIQLFKGARQMLEQLRPDHDLYLVTSGHPATQKQKVSILDLEPLFREVHYVDSKAGESKGPRFAQIASRHGRAPSEHLVIGDRLDREIRDGNRLGMRTCHICYGEFNHLTPESEDDRPDYQIRHITELIDLL